ncbi:pilus assembly protein [Pseudoalteromonas umbrosa]|uniref:pilus assembly protein n=1 Tax=Pseudoalteromonas umbrosa TaxID=3048489 RepID=UPI0024C451E5|nr:PilC/PilY family type IV pilus protein [Pseudoalteromonas sp. B95]MDK1287263.1 PilC/PilY family type IV pilus protein [Pseudoalteromonas sp. B95]
MKYFKKILLVCFLISCGAYAEDIELYVKHDVSGSEKSRVIVIFDTSGSMAWDVNDGRRCYEYRNWRLRSVDCFDTSKTSKACYKYINGRYRSVNCGDSRLKVAQDAMVSLVNNNPDFDFGLMRLYSSSGGYVLNGIGADPSVVISKINSLRASGSTPLSETLWEAYLYLTGRAVDYGYNGGNNRDKSIEVSGVYKSPFAPVAGDPERCDTSTNVILMTDGDPTSDSGKNSAIATEYFNKFGSYPTAVSNSYLNSLAKLMRGTSETQIDLYPTTSDKQDFARVYTIGFGTGMSNAGKALLKQTGEIDGGGDYLHANTASQLSEALKLTISKIREQSDSFSSPSVSTSSSDLSRSGDSVYFTMFYPETHTRWAGNLKKLKVSGGIVHGSSSTTNAINDQGQIDKSVTTYWSAPSSKDGNVVLEGGINYQLTERQTVRRLYSDYGKGALYDFDYASALNAHQGSLVNLAAKLDSSTTEVQNTILWARGLDIDDQNGNRITNERRKDIFGDPLHSRPVTIDYGNDDLRVIVGTNAGFLHMFKDKGETVEESWAFIPDSLLDILKPLRDRRQDTKLYGMDGPITVYFWDKNDSGVVDSGEKVWLIAGMRRGGNEYYGFDITVPDQPRMLWGGPIKGGVGDFTELGQSWSKPIVSFITAQPEKPVLIFGAGYDTNKDNATFTEDSKGRGIYIVDLESGKPVWSLTPDNGFKGEHSIAADVSVLDSDYDGYVDRIYAADTGGGLWRVDLPSSKPNDEDAPWTHFMLANLSGGNDNAKRRFFYRPMIARTYFSKVTEEIVDGKATTIRRDVPYEGILIGSGNRAKPTSTNIKNFLFMVRDENTKTQSFTSDNTPSVIRASNLFNVTNDPFKSSLDSYENFIDQEVELGKAKGWKIKLEEGEKSLSAATAIGGLAYFTSFSPTTVSENQCSIGEGTGYLYIVHLHYGMQVFQLRRYRTTATLPDTPRTHYDVYEDPITKKKTVKAKIISPTVIKEDALDDMFGGNPADGIDPYKLEPPNVYKNTDGSANVPGVSPLTITYETRQLYIYKKEDNDEK